MAAIASAPVQTKKNYLTALKEAISEEMAVNGDMVCLGEDIGQLGGAFGVTEGLQDSFGTQRVIDMPIAEAAIIGASVGLALNGKTVMAEMQFIDFITCGFDQIVNMMATYHYRTAGEVNLPVVVRGPAGAYGGGALYHSQMNEAWFCNSPGLRVVCPSTPYDAKGLLKAALRDGNPCIFFEIKELYRRSEIAEILPEDDYIVPLGKAAVRREELTSRWLATARTFTTAFRRQPNSKSSASARKSSTSEVWFRWTRKRSSLRWRKRIESSW